MMRTTTMSSSTTMLKRGRRTARTIAGPAVVAALRTRRRIRGRRKQLARMHHSIPESMRRKSLIDPPMSSIDW